MPFLVDNRPASSQYRAPRREEPSGLVVVHSTESAADLTPPDRGAENVANFIRTRSDPGSYHHLTDADSIIHLVPFEWEAFHDGTGTNRHSYGVSVAMQAHTWPQLPKAWVDAAVRNMAKAVSVYANWLRSRRGIVIPARRVSVAQARNRVPGFISHAELDPARRTDPGRDFPWRQFLDEYARLTDQQEDDLTPDQARKLNTIYTAVKYLRDGSSTDVGTHTIFHRARGAHENTKRILTQLGAIGDVDEQAIAAAVLEGLDPAEIAAAIPTDIARQVADVLAERLAS